MSLESAWRRVMAYCDGETAYPRADPGDELEHLRTDMITINDARLSEVAAARRDVERIYRASRGEGPVVTGICAKHQTIECDICTLAIKSLAAFDGEGEGGCCEG